MKYICEKCDKRFDELDDCVWHEDLCKGKFVRYYIKFGSGVLYIKGSINSKFDLTPSVEKASVFEYSDSTAIIISSIKQILKDVYDIRIGGLYNRRSVHDDASDEIIDEYIEIYTCIRYEMV
jgi:hypothetical protein